MGGAAPTVTASSSKQHAKTRALMVNWPHRQLPVLMSTFLGRPARTMTGRQIVSTSRLIANWATPHLLKERFFRDQPQRMRHWCGDILASCGTCSARCFRPLVLYRKQERTTAHTAMAETLAKRGAVFPALLTVPIAIISV